MKPIQVVLFIIITVFISIKPVTVGAVVGETAIATYLGGKAVSSIINDVRLTGVGLIDQAGATGNAIISRAGNEANVLAGNLDILFKEDVNLVFDKLSEERKLVLIEAEAVRRKLAAVKDTAYNLKDSAVLDLNSIIVGVPFIKDEFFVQSVRGLSYLPQASNFRIQIAATTLGIQEKVSTRLEVWKKNGNSTRLLDGVIVDQSQQRFFADLALPSKHFAEDFNDTELVLVPLIVRFIVERKKGWWIFSSLEKKIYDIPIYLNLFPRSAGTISMHTKRPTYAWVPAGTKTDTYPTPNRHCKKKCGGEPTRGGNRIEFAVNGGPEPFKVGNKRLINPRYACVGGNCGYSDSFRIALTENDTRLIFTWDTWSTSGTWEASADVLEYRVAGEASESTKPLQAYFGQILQIPVAADYTFGIAKVKMFTKQEYELQIGQPDTNGMLTYQGKSEAGPNLSRITYRVNAPSAAAVSYF